jgi:HSP20 family protein
MFRIKVFEDNFKEDKEMAAYLPFKKGFDLFDEMFKAPDFGGTFDPSMKVLKTDIKETKDSFVIEMDLPGYKKEDIKADLNEGYLNITVSRNFNKDENNGNYIRKERYEGTCKRTFYVGDGLREDDVKASYVDGVLTLTIPKEPEPVPQEPKYISID